MHPVLLQLPFPRSAVPLAPALLGLAVVALMVVALGARARARDLVVLGGAGAALAVWSAVGHRGESVQLGPVPIYSFGAMLCVGLLAGWLACQRLAARDGLSRDAVASCYLVTAASGLAGARVLYVLTNLGDFESIGDALAFRGGGLVFYGGVLGGLAGSLAFTSVRPLSFPSWSDVAAPSLAIGAAFGRVGCYLAGCDYGVRLSKAAPAWLVRLGTFPRWSDDIAGAGAGSPAWVDQVLYRGLPPDSVAALPVHPTQLYEALAELFLLAVLLRLGARRAFRGQVFLVFVAGYGLLRFLLEALRDDPERGFVGPASPPAVLLSVGLLVFAAAFATGPAASIRSPAARWAARVGALAMPVAAYAALAGAGASPLRPSTSQVVSLLSAPAVAAAWRWLSASGGPSGAAPRAPFTPAAPSG